jgi:hypothetical protein
MKMLKRRRTGLALVLVISVLAFAAIIGFAMLSTASMQAQTTLNSNLALSADALADSGVDLACYYLINPAKAPKAVPVGGFYDGGTITFGSKMPGSVDLTITQLASDGDYKIVSIGRASTSPGRSIAHTVTATVHVNSGYQVKSIVAFSGNGTLPLSATVNGDIQANGILINLGIVNGNVLSPNPVQGTGSILGGLVAITPNNNTPIPTPVTLRSFSTYSYNGNTYSAGVITGLPTGTTLGPTISNPAGIYRYSGTLTMNHNVTINGTLIVENGDLNISGGGNAITPADGFPALIAKGNVWVRGTLLPSNSPRDLTVNGLAWLGGSLKYSGLLSNAFFAVNGALQFGNSGTVDTLFIPPLRVNKNANKVAGLNIDSTVPPASATVLAYKQ